MVLPVNLALGQVLTYLLSVNRVPCHPHSIPAKQLLLPLLTYEDPGAP